MKHEEKHAVAMWLLAAFLGGFALLAWWVGSAGREEGVPAPRPGIERPDSLA
ncbi:MAG TPA: hypothetical protein VHG51_07755 [Longimicrobiaceae bacterium]|nr:hypothetical protein [Longimicrobiaceae bacterium]